MLQRFRRRREINDEIEAHIAIEARQRIDRGEAPADAAANARREFGNATLVAEVTRSQWGWTTIERLLNDARYGWRILTKTPGFTAVAVLTLALGIGATTAIFSIVHTVLLRPLPFPESERLVTLWTSIPSMRLPKAFVGIANYIDWRAQNRVFVDIGITRLVANLNLTGEGRPERLEGGRISESVLPVLGVAPMLGRNITEQERQTDAHVAILSHGLWVRRFGSEPGVLGRTIRLNGIPHQVIGVMPRDFRYPTDRHEIWVPLFFPPDELQTRIGYNYVSVARLRAGVTLEQARTDMRRLATDEESVAVESMLETVTGGVRKPLLAVLIGVAAMLAIGCANLAGLLLARATARRREMSIRVALGAGRGRLAAQLMAEVIPLGLFGAALGILFARFMLDRLIPFLPADMPRVYAIGLHPTALLVGIAAALITVVAAALVPAINLAPRPSLRNGLVVAQIGITLALIVVCGLMLRSLQTVAQVDPGFSSEGVLTMHLAAARSQYPKDTDVAAYIARLLTAVKDISGIQAAAMVNRLPLSGTAQTGPLEFEGAGHEANSDFRTITPEYFRAMRIPLLAGREFTDRDDERSRVVGIIDERLAREMYPGQSPIGRRFRMRVRNIFIGQWVEIVGVVGHIRNDSLESDLRPQVYWNYRQRTQDRMVLVVRTQGDPASFTASVVQRIHTVDAEQPVYDIRTMAEWRDRALRQRYLTTGLISAFGVASLLLAMVGVYGVVSYSVSTRTREFGIRIALGATARGIRTLVLRDALRLALFGIAAGAVIAALAAVLVRSLLFGVSATDSLVLAAAPALLLLTALTAAMLPARRAVGAEPVAALRHQ